MREGTAAEYNELANKPHAEKRRMGFNTRVHDTEIRLTGVVIAQKIEQYRAVLSKIPPVTTYYVNETYLTPKQEM